MKRFFKNLSAPFSLDYRSLALLRIGLGFAVLVDVAIRAVSLVRDYTDAGVLPRALLLTNWHAPYDFSLLMSNGGTWLVVFIFILITLSALSLLVGYRTKLALFVTWFLLISIQARNPLILQGGDIVLRVVLFFGLFLPLARRYSIDALLHVSQNTEKKVLSFATMAYVVQIFIFYFMTAILKTGSAWHADGTAVYQALSVDQLVTPLGIWLRQFPQICMYLTHITWWAELGGAVMLLIPWWKGRIRVFGIFLFFCLQIGFNTTMRLGDFGLIAIIVTFGLLPPLFWDTCTHVIRKIRRFSHRGYAVYYDADCTFCARVVSGISQILMLHPATQTYPSTIDAQKEKEMYTHNSWIVVSPDGISHYGFDGIIVLCRASVWAQIAAPILSLYPIRVCGAYIYRRIAERRLVVCLPETTRPSVSRSRYVVTSLFLVVTTLYILAWNINTIPTHHILPERWEWFGRTVRLDQSFDMFAPTPWLEDGWYAIPGKLANGDIIDLFNHGGDVRYTKPEFVAYTYDTQRDQKYMMNISDIKYAPYREGYAKYLCRQWNGVHDMKHQVVTFSIMYMMERTMPPGQSVPIEPLTLWEHSCF